MSTDWVRAELGSDAMTEVTSERISRSEEGDFGSEETFLRLQAKAMTLEEKPLRPEKQEKQSDKLLPGFPDDITLDKITPSVPWREFLILASVSRGWHMAIRNHYVYDARVRSHSTETFIIVKYQRTHLDIRAIGLCFLRDNSFFELPRIPRLKGGVPELSKLVAVDGKIYVLGGVDEASNPCEKVYVFDLAGRGQWTPCACMQEPRDSFACGVIDGKIFVFAGITSGGPDCKSEVYDPKENVWSPITPMSSLRFDHEVVVMGEELVVYGGLLVVNDEFPTDANVLEIYHSVKDEWRAVEHFPRQTGVTFLAQGKIHLMDSLGICVHNPDVRSWTRLYSYSFTADSLEFRPYFVVAVDDELFVLGASNADHTNVRSLLLRGKGLGNEKKEILWREVREWVPYNHKLFLCPIQL